jgi:hypothetical protein
MPHRLRFVLTIDVENGVEMNGKRTWIMIATITVEG